MGNDISFLIRRSDYSIRYALFVPLSITKSGPIFFLSRDDITLILLLLISSSSGDHQTFVTSTSLSTKLPRFMRRISRKKNSFLLSWMGDP